MNEKQKIILKKPGLFEITEKRKKILELVIITIGLILFLVTVNTLTSLMPVLHNFLAILFGLIIPVLVIVYMWYYEK